MLENVLRKSKIIDKAKVGGSKETFARILVDSGKVALVEKLNVVVVAAHRTHTVSLGDTSCSCSTLKDCVHITAAQIYVGIYGKSLNLPIKGSTLSRLIQKSRKIKGRGRKRPLTGSELQVTDGEQAKKPTTPVSSPLKPQESNHSSFLRCGGGELMIGSIY